MNLFKRLCAFELPLGVLALVSGSVIYMTPLPSLNVKSTTQVIQGKRIFHVKCQVCHGTDATGILERSANLTQRISLHSARYAIQNGAHNFNISYPSGMPAMVSDDEKAINIAAYVASGFDESYERGALLYKLIKCARCHGEKGEGKEYLGPNIRAFDKKLIADILWHGKEGFIGKMPAFKELSNSQKASLSAYIMSLQK